MSTFRFHTEVDIPTMTGKTGYSTKNMFIGSCFTENIGNRMAALKFNVDVNPFGILYNPASIASGLRFLLQNKKFDSTDLVWHQDMFHSLAHHGRFSYPSEAETLSAINQRAETAAKYLQNTDFLFITFGTAWVYTWKETGRIVANCHKIPAVQFDRSRLSVTAIVNDYIALFKQLRELNPNLKVVFTVSPIRHWKDGAIENQRSKATLLLAIDEIMKAQTTPDFAYFPSYEIMMDELRDYRFYADDMLHISDMALNYIWEKFVANFIDPESRIVAHEVEKIIKAANHRLSAKKSKAQQDFLKKMLEKVLILEKKYQELNLQDEKQYFKAGLTS